MNFIYRCISLILLPLLLFACNTENDPIKDVSQSNPEESLCEYYVKYESIVSSKYSLGNESVTVRVLTESGESTFVVPSKWDGIFGPFKDARILRMYVDLKNGTPDYVREFAAVRCRISICKGNAPFALKTEDYGAMPMSIRYQVVDLDYK